MRSDASLPLPTWIEVGVLPLLNVALALVAAGLLVWALGQDPWLAVRLLVDGAFGSPLAWGYTLYYTTNYLCTGLAVAVAFRGGHFNIGAEGQATLGGLGAGLLLLGLDAWLPAPLLLPLGVLAGAAAGGLWAFVPALLQSWRGSHVVVTTIMFNFLAAALMVWLLVDVVGVSTGLAVESRRFAPDAALPGAQALLAQVGIDVPDTPLNLAFVLALLACAGVWLLLWRTGLGLAVRTVGLAPDAARYAGHDPKRLTLLSLTLSGALAGLAGVNEIVGVHHKLLLDFVAGAGYTGIAVALLGRNHPLGIVLAALLFGALAQGGSELVFEMPAFTRDMSLAVQGLVVLFCGALAAMPRPWVARAWAGWGRWRAAGRRDG
ncbi:ABC transporter permease [Caldimonas brevitalea]|uniref:Sugar ABC transporter permease n=1 Tax=Caldimonas brevitalea TaxID=413882 RepID=A0A0G3BP77_9BURK|nr:ABC transporter permease [Caldimonas brevitalea]AKJ29176.1 sugar ABC transporter permease [Caldimonas brevitalea]